MTRLIYGQDMTTEQLQAARSIRARREKVQRWVLAAAMAVVFATIALTPDGSELVGVVLVVFAAAIIGSALAVQRDEWHRARALRSVAIAFVAAVLTQVGESVWVTIDNSHRPNPGRALSVVTFVWLLSDYFLRQRADSEE